MIDSARHLNAIRIKQPRRSPSCLDRWQRDARQFLIALASALALSSTAANSPETPSEPAPPHTAREFFNAGTRKLREGKFKEAEALFESALATQDEQVQPGTLYNLGHVRFNQGVEELKQSPPVSVTTARARTAAQSADDASLAADDALGGSEVQKMVAAYMRGRGARRDLKAATAAVRRALDAHGAALAKWQRASSDFKGTFEMNSADNEARDNAESMERRIARLIDAIRELEATAAALSEKNKELGEKLKQLKGRIPAPDMPPGAAGDDEDEDQPFGSRPEQKEGPTREGHEITLSPEEAAWLLETYGLDSEHQLPMTQKTQGQPRDKSGPTW